MNPDSCPEYKGGDILKELSLECKNAGIHFGVYTTIMDWHDPTQKDYGGKIAEGHTKEEYKTALKGQLKELIEDYGVEVFFFDGEWVSWWTADDGRELYRYILSLNENCIVNNRVGKRDPSDGDYGTPEQEIPSTGLNYDWESNVTMNNSFGYKKGDDNWKSAQWIVNSVVDIASKGGNMLLNVGPDGSGVVEAAPLENMALAGEWFNKFGEAVYGTEKSCFSKSIGKDVKVTVKNDEGKIYVILLETDPVLKGSVSIPALENEIIGVKELANGNDVPYEAFENELLLYVGQTEKQQLAAVYEISVKDVPQEKEIKTTADDLAKGKSVTVSSNYDGSTSFSGIEIYEKHLPNPHISFENAPYVLENFPVSIGGKFTDGSSVTLRVWDVSFAAFEIEVEVNKENGTWQAVIDEEKLSKGGITFTAILLDENGSQAAVTAYTAEYNNAG